MNQGEPLLVIDNLTVEFGEGPDSVRAVDNVTLSVGAGETLALVGASGSGKSVTIMTALGLLRGATKISGAAELCGHRTVGRAPRALTSVLGRDVGVVFQDPLASLNPTMRVGAQIAEAIRLHDRSMSRAQRRARVEELLHDVGVPDPRRRATLYPHNLSGGLRQRAAIAMAIANRPPLLVADEPTTALDVTVQAQILELMRRLQREHRMGLLLVTHDLGVVADMADRVVVMEHGRVVEEGATQQIFSHPSHSYTTKLLTSVPRIDRSTIDRRGAESTAAAATSRDPATVGADEPTSDPSPEGPGSIAAELRDLVVHYRGRDGSTIHAACGVSLSVGSGTVLCLVGESGSGKTTVLRAMSGMIEPTRGEALVGGERVTSRDRLAARRSQALQMVFQDPRSSLNPRMTVRRIIAEPLKLGGKFHAYGGDDYIVSLMERVGLSAELADRRPGQLSGGQCQRVAIARAVAPRPQLVLLDEPVSALDVIVQSQVLGTLASAVSVSSAGFVFVTHDLAVVRQIADRVAVMYLGKIVEAGPVEQVLTSPSHPYTQLLLSAVLVPEVRRRPQHIPLGAETPSPSNPPSGCRFQLRCPLRRDVCAGQEPRLEPISDAPQHWAACHFAGPR